MNWFVQMGLPSAKIGSDMASMLAEGMPRYQLAEGAARLLVDVLRQRFADKDFIVLGDFNDNPDDRSLNILETGDSNAAGGAEEIDGPFLINLMEPLVAAGIVSHVEPPAILLATGSTDLTRPVGSGITTREEQTRTPATSCSTSY